MDPGVHTLAASLGRRATAVLQEDVPEATAHPDRRLGTLFRVSVHICFVCLGNICRSPMAASVFRDQLHRAGLDDAVRITSAGLGDWHRGKSADPRAQATLEEHGYPVEHTAKQVDPDHLGADLILASDRSHLEELRRMVDDPDRVHLLRDFDPSAPPNAEIPDPYYGNNHGFLDVLGMIERAVPGVIEWVRRHQ